MADRHDTLVARRFVESWTPQTKVLGVSKLEKRPSPEPVADTARTTIAATWHPLASVAVLVAIGALAFALRVSYLTQIETIPFFSHPVGDAAAYLSWGERIAAGHWWGGETFYQAPAYPYFLGIVQFVLGENPWTIRIVQSALGALACVAIAGVGWLLLNRSSGIAGGLILAAYPPAIFFDGLVQKASLGLALMAALLLLLAWIARSSRAASTVAARAPSDRSRVRLCLVRWAGVGMVLALLALTRENALVLIVVVLAWIWIRFHGQRIAARLARSAALLVGISVLLLPVGIRNAAVGGEFALTTVQSGPNFYIGNSEIATGRYVPLRRGHESPPFERSDATELAEQATRRSLTPGEVSRYWWSQACHFTSTHPGRWLALLSRKWLLVWNAYEIPDTESYYLYRDWSPLLGTLGTVLHFGVICPLAAVGIVTTWSRRRDLGLLYALIVGLAAGVAMFYVSARYRYPLVPMLVVLAGAGVVDAWRAVRAFQGKTMALAALAAAATALVVNLPVNPEHRLNAMAYVNLGSVLARQGKLTEATRFFEYARREAPDSGEARFNLGVAYALQGRFEPAVEEYRAALRCEPNLIHVHYNLGVALEALGQTEAAVAQFQRALAADPTDEAARQALQRLTAGGAAPPPPRENR